MAYPGWVALSPSGDTSGARDLAVITAALAKDQTVLLRPGNYYLNGPVPMVTGAQLVGSGPQNTVLIQNSTTANGITATDTSDILIEGLRLAGPGTGSGCGIRLQKSAAADIGHLTVRRVQLSGWGSHCLYGTVVVVSRFDNVVCFDYQADGFRFDGGVNTSLAFTACYADGQAGSGTGNGYTLSNCVYCSLSGCASDYNAWGYDLEGCSGVTLDGCGAEHSSSDNFVLRGGNGNVLSGCWCTANAHDGVALSSSEANATITGFSEVSPGAATASIAVASGCSAVVINPDTVTAASYAAGTAYVITKTGGVVH